MNRTLAIRTYQDSLDNWHAIIEDDQGNTLIDMPRYCEYGLPTEAEAFAAARKVIDDVTAQHIDIAGGGYAG